MRIACIHVPQFALQCTTRLDPSLRGAAIAVVGGVEPGRERAGVLHAPVVLACSRAAWAKGVRLGMTAAAARGQSPDVVVVNADAIAERETVRAIADALLAASGVVDLGGRVGAGGAHLAMYAEVPSKTRGTSFGDRLVELLAELGLSARIGIADDRFTAWVAAAHGNVQVRNERRAGAHDNDRRAGSADNERRAGAHDEDPQGQVVSVPRGGSAAFLAPRPLSLLAIPSEVQHMLEALGVRTLGEFAALPAPSVARPLEADYQGLARGESGAALRSYLPEAAIREEVLVTSGNVLETPGALGGPAAIALVASRIALRLAGRGRGAARLDVTVIAGDRNREFPVTIDGAIVDADALVRVLLPVLDAAAAELAPGQVAAHGGWRLRVVVAGEALMNGDAVDVAALAGPFARAAGARASFAPSESHNEATIHPLAVVLSSSGSLFALSPPALRAERRDAHRRTRRGKQRRSRPTTPIGQSRLFDRSSSK